MTHLLESLNTSKLVLKNRLIMPPLATEKCGEEGKPSKALLDYYDEKSRGGYISLIIIEHSFISQQGKASERQLSVADDSTIEGLRKVADIIHKNGCKAVMQLNHAGSGTTREVTGSILVAPSAVENPFMKSGIPRELTYDEIQGIVKSFKDAAVRVKAAGFDGVEIHSAHGYLLNQFYSPLTNKRTDEYGGDDVKDRIKIHLQVIKAVREAVGDEFPIFMRLGASDYMEGGTTLEDSKAAVCEFEKAGLDVLDISGGFCRFTVPGNNSQGYFSELSGSLKQFVSIPVILTGGITKAEVAEELLADVKADLIGVGRAMYKDSSWAKRAVESFEHSKG